MTLCQEYLSQYTRGTLTHRKIIGVMLFLSFVGLATHSSATAASSTSLIPATPTKTRSPRHPLDILPRFAPDTPKHLAQVATLTEHTSSHHQQLPVPFYSQFSDISSPTWQKVGCGIASLAMLIDYYSDDSVAVDTLLEAGITSGAYIDDAGWSHAGLIALAGEYGLVGASKSLAHLSSSAAFAELETVLAEGPVMVSVHYTFEPTNPIPHLVVVHRVADERIYYNDPAETAGNNSITVEKFKRAWKQRYIEIRPRT